MYTYLSLSLSCYNTLAFKVPTNTVIVTCLLNLDKLFFTPSVDRSVCNRKHTLIDQSDRYCLEKLLGQITQTSSYQCFSDVSVKLQLCIAYTFVSELNYQRS